jgi:hypothetical protein
MYVEYLFIPPVKKQTSGVVVDEEIGGVCLWGLLCVSPEAVDAAIDASPVGRFAYEERLRERAREQLLTRGARGRTPISTAAPPTHNNTNYPLHANTRHGNLHNVPCPFVI